MLDPIKHLERAVALLDTQENLAEKLGLKHQSNVSQWLTGRRPLPAKHCRTIEQLTGGRVTRYQLRPDIFGTEPETVSDAA